MTSGHVQIGSRLIGVGQPCFLIAEVGTTCLGELGNALALIEAAANAGVDAVKFQMIDPEQLSDSNVQYPIIAGGQRKMMNMKDMFFRLSFTDNEWERLRDACYERGLEFFATVDHLAGVDRLEAFNVPVHKMGAWDATYRPLFEKMAKTGKPLFMDLGPATEEEIADMVTWFLNKGGKTLLFMHDFHTHDDRQMNLRAIQRINELYPVWPAGFSSPGVDNDLDIAALAIGAAHIEKRLILSRKIEAFHVHESLEPEELKDWVLRMRHVERALGRKIIEPSDTDREQSHQHYRSACTIRPIRQGELFTLQNLDGKRPGTGLSAGRLPEIWGQRAARDLPANTLIKAEDIA